MSYDLEIRNANDPPDIEPMLIWTDIPYNTGKVQSSWESSYRDDNALDVLTGLQAWSKQLASDGTMVVCCDYRMAWRVCATLNVARMHFAGEIIWEFGLGRPRDSWWPNRHNHLLTFTHSSNSGKWDKSAVPRAKRLAPKVGYANDKPIGSVWEFTMSNTHPDRIGYPNQKPLEIVTPFILAHTDRGDLVVDPYCGSSTTGIAAIRNGRDYWGGDIDPPAIRISRERMENERGHDAGT